MQLSCACTSGEEDSVFLHGGFVLLFSSTFFLFRWLCFPACPPVLLLLYIYLSFLHSALFIFSKSFIAVCVSRCALWRACVCLRIVLSASALCLPMREMKYIQNNAMTSIKRKFHQKCPSACWRSIARCGCGRLAQIQKPCFQEIQRISFLSNLDNSLKIMSLMIVSSRPVTRLEHQGWRRVCSKGPMSNSFDLCSTHFSRGGETFCRGLNPPTSTVETFTLFQIGWTPGADQFNGLPLMPTPVATHEVLNWTS